MIATLAAGGVVTIATRGIARRFSSGSQKDVVAHLSRCLIVTVILWSAFGVAFFAFADWFSLRVLRNARAVDFLGIAVILGLPLAITQVGYAFLAGMNDFRRLAKIRAFTGIVGALLLVASAYTLSVYFVVAAAVFASALSAWIGIRESFLQIRESVSSACVADADKKVKPVDGDGDDGGLMLPAVATGVISIPIVWLCQSIASGAGGGLVPFAALTVISMWAQGILLVPLNIGQPLLPEMVKALRAGNRDRAARRLLLAGAALIAAFAIPASFVLIVGSSYILGIYGAQFLPFEDSFDILVVAVTFQALTIPAIAAIQAAGRLWVHFLCNAIWAGIFLCLTFFFRSTGVSGYVLAYLVASIFHVAQVNFWAFIVLRSRIDTADA